MLSSAERMTAMDTWRLPAFSPFAKKKLTSLSLSLSLSLSVSLLCVFHLKTKLFGTRSKSSLAYKFLYLYDIVAC